MTTQWLTSSAENTGAFSAADRLVCRSPVPYIHKLRSAVFWCENVVKAGTIVIKLMHVDKNEARGGTQVGSSVTNTDITNASSIHTKFTFTLGDDDKLQSPADRMYYLLMQSDNTTDRMDEPQLVLELDDLKR